MKRIGVALAREPTRSFPEAMASQLEALYRFLDNRSVSFERVLGPHAERTAERGRSHDGLLVLHDTTDLEFAGKREGLGPLQTRARKGFFLHVSLAVTLNREPLGVLAAEPWTRAPSSRAKNNKRQSRKNPARESLRWWRGVQRCEVQLDNAGQAVHVMDREGDNYDLFAHLQAESVRHVVRLAHNRNLVGAGKLKDVALRAKTMFRRKVRVARRARALPFGRGYPARDARDATLAVSAVAVQFATWGSCTPLHPSQPLGVDAWHGAERGDRCGVSANRPAQLSLSINTGVQSLGPHLSSRVHALQSTHSPHAPAAVQ